VGVIHPQNSGCIHWESAKYQRQTRWSAR